MSQSTEGLRVLHLLSGQEKGGITRVVAALSAGLRMPGAKTIIGTLGGTRAVLPDGVHVSFRRRGPFDLLAVARLKAFTRREAITIVHTHNVTANLYGLLLKLTRRPPIHIIHVHAHFRQILRDSQSSRVRRLLLLRGNAYALRVCDRVIANSDSVRDFLLEYAVDPATIHVIYNGVDIPRLEEEARLPCPMTDTLSARSFGSGQGRTRVVGAFGRLAPEKNYPLFLEAARLVRDREPAQFVIAGDGPERSRLERLARRLGIAENVHFVGWLDNPYPLLATMDVVASTSETEGFGLVLLEAWALERPVVATAVGAIPEIVRDGVTGVLVPAGDVAALAGAIVRLLRDPGLSRTLGERGKKLARREFSETAMRDRVEGVYLSALTRRSGAGGDQT